VRTPLPGFERRAPSRRCAHRREPPAHARAWRGGAERYLAAEFLERRGLGILPATTAPAWAKSLSSRIEGN